MTPHPFADVLIAIAQGKKIQWRHIDGHWLDIHHSAALSVISCGLPTTKPDRFRIVN
jgi:hypothetical protein